MKNVLINCVSAGSGGALAYLINLVPLLLDKESKGELKFKLLVKKKQAELLDDKYSSFLIIAPDLNGYKRFLWEYFNLSNLVKKNNIDIIFTPYQIARVFKSVTNVVMFRNMEPFTFHKYRNTYKNWIRNKLLKYKTIHTINNADMVIAVSCYVRDVMLQNGMTTDDKIIQIYHGRNPVFTPENNAADSDVLKSLNVNRNYIFTCGSLFPYRKSEDIIKAFSKLQDLNIQLVIAGNSNDDQYKQLLDSLIKDNCLSDKVLMLGHVSLHEMTVLYRRSQLFVTATETEACPNIAIEALSSGCNIISSDVMPLPEMFCDAAQYFSHGDIDSLARMIRKLYNEGSADNHKSINRARHFAWDKCADETYNLLVRA